MVINSKTNNFQIKGNINTQKLNLVMTVPNQKYLYTRSLPATVPVLSKKLPSIFECECFNNTHCGFKKECKNTELGHLFEHIMLEYLCMAKLDSGEAEAIYEGVTSWDWVREPRGTFNIEITAGSKDLKFIKKAFGKSVYLLSAILEN